MKRSNYDDRVHFNVSDFDVDLPGWTSNCMRYRITIEHGAAVDGGDVFVATFHSDPHGDRGAVIGSGMRRQAREACELHAKVLAARDGLVGAMQEAVDKLKDAFDLLEDASDSAADICREVLELHIEPEMVKPAKVSIEWTETVSEDCCSYHDAVENVGAQVEELLEKLKEEVRF